MGGTNQASAGAWLPVWGGAPGVLGGRGGTGPYLQGNRIRLGPFGAVGELMDCL